MRMLALAPVAGATLALSMGLAMAAGPYDGTWVIASPQATSDANPTDPTGCQPVQFQVQVRDNQISGDLQQQTLGRANVGNSPTGTPVTGQVAPDGTISAQWQNVIATGKLSGGSGQLRWSGQCGPRMATATRVSTAQ